MSRSRAISSREAASHFDGMEDDVQIDEKEEETDQSVNQSNLASPWPTIDKEAIRGRRVLTDVPSSDTIRFMFATDNHVGYLENDPIRGNDSFLAFEEILYQAQIHCVDFIVLGGDLYHENKPSRACQLRVSQLIRDYCFGDKYVPFEIVSDQAINFAPINQVNFADPNCNVAMPIFMIHGNHDDPAGLGSLSALDLLATNRLINYFGKSSRVDKITNYPILLQKGCTRMALYGLGNIRDERLHRTFVANEVKWVKPVPDDQPSENGDWFNICVIHQNRTPHSFSDKNFISETMLPNFLDVVFWGHEHECLMQDQSDDGDVVVVQPGSSVATSLSAGEAKDKHIAIVEINGDNYRILPVPLGTVRPFVIADVRLEDLTSADDSDLLKAVEEALADKITEMMQSINAEEKFKNRDRPALPLLRLRVEHTGFPRINSSKFGQRFANQVANPEDLLLFYKQAKGARKSAGKAEKVAVDSDLLGDRTVDEAPPIHAILDALIGRHPLAVLPESKFADAIEEFVEKKSLTSINDFIENSLRRASNSVKAACANKNVSELTKEEIERLLRHYHEVEAADDSSRIKTKRESDQAILDGLDLDAIDRITSKKAPAKGGKSKKNESSDDDDDYGLDDDDDDPPPAKKPAARRGKAAKAAAAKPARSRVAKLEFEPVDEAMEESEDAIESPRSAQSGRGRKAVKRDEEEAAPVARAAPAKRGRVKQETAPAAPIPMGNRNRAGELSFLTSSKPARGKAAASKSAGSRARPIPMVDLIDD